MTSGGGKWCDLIVSHPGDLFTGVNGNNRNVVTPELTPNRHQKTQQQKKKPVDMFRDSRLKHDRWRCRVFDVNRQKYPPNS